MLLVSLGWNKKCVVLPCGIDMQFQFLFSLIPRMASQNGSMQNMSKGLGFEIRLTWLTFHPLINCMTWG